jgi:hypothetical protein
MEGVTAAIVAFLLTCVVFPTIVKNKPQYYAAFAAMLLVILLSGLEAVISTGAFHALATFLICLLQISALILLILSCGGLSWDELTGEVSEAIEVIRRGESEKEVIVPLRGEQPAVKPDAPGPPEKPQVKVQDAGGSVPME